MNDLITVLTIDSHDVYPWLVRLICRCRGWPVPTAGHARLIVRGAVFELTTDGVYQTELDEYVIANSDTICDVIHFRSPIADLVVDRILTLAMAGCRLRWWSVLQLLLTGRSEELFCTDLVLLALGYPLNDRPRTPDEMMEMLRNELQDKIL